MFLPSRPKLGNSVCPHWSRQRTHIDKKAQWKDNVVTSCGIKIVQGHTHTCMHLYSTVLNINETNLQKVTNTWANI